jgi:RNA polymerase sigma-70 factor (ECF subfamily)
VELAEVVTPATQELGVALRDATGAADLERDIFLLRELVGLRYDEIASACDVSVESVRSRLHQARQALRTSMGTSLDLEASGVRCAARPEAVERSLEYGEKRWTDDSKSLTPSWMASAWIPSI